MNTTSNFENSMPLILSKLAFVVLLSFLSSITTADVRPIDQAFSNQSIGAVSLLTIPNRYGSDFYVGSEFGYGLQYTHIMKDKWSIGIGFGFRTFNPKLDEPKEHFFKFYQDSSRLFRIRHPLWCSLGLRIGQMVGIEKVELPYTRNRNHSPEFIAGISSSVIWIFESGQKISASATQWRGTARNKIEGLDVEIALHHEIQ
jgi:hypothetical protein